MLEHHGCGLAKMRAFDELAPYRAVKPAWSFYYLAVNPSLESRLSEPEHLGPVGVRRRLELQVRPPIRTADDVPSGRLRTHTG